MTKGGGPLWPHLRRAAAGWPRPPRTGSPPAWTMRMSLIAVLAAVATLALAAFDVPVTAALSSVPAFVAVSMSLTDIAAVSLHVVGWLTISMALVVMDWGYRDRRRRFRLAFYAGQAGFAFLAVSGSGLLTRGAKFLIGRARPEMELGPAHFAPFSDAYDFGSFPSGHGTVAGALTVAALALWPRAAPVVVPLGILLAFFRVGAGAHWPSDALAGFAVGALFALWLARWLARRNVVFRPAGNGLLPRPRFVRDRRRA